MNARLKKTHDVIRRTSGFGDLESICNGYVRSGQRSASCNGSSGWLAVVGWLRVCVCVWLVEWLVGWLVCAGVRLRVCLRSCLTHHVQRISMAAAVGEAAGIHKARHE